MSIRKIPGRPGFPKRATSGPTVTFFFVARRENNHPALNVSTEQ